MVVAVGVAVGVAVAVAAVAVVAAVAQVVCTTKMVVSSYPCKMAMVPRLIRGTLSLFTPQTLPGEGASETPSTVMLVVEHLAPATQAQMTSMVWDCTIV